MKIQTKTEVLSEKLQIYSLSMQNKISVVLMRTIYTHLLSDFINNLF